jgi:hypothetical protein
VGVVRRRVEKTTKIILLNLVLLPFTTVSVQAATDFVRDEYVPNEIIVKFRAAVANTLEGQLQVERFSSEPTLSKGLDELNARYRLREIKPAFKDFKKRRRQLKALRRKNKTLLNPREKRILMRLRRAPKDAKVPELDRIYKLELDLRAGQSLRKVVAAYSRDPDIEYAELNYAVSICRTPNDPLCPLQWSLNNVGQGYPASGLYNPPPGTPDSDIDAPEAWDKSTGISDIIVAIIDTGVDYTHRDLNDNMWINEMELDGVAGVDDDGNGYVDDIYGYDFINDDNDPIDDQGHGTHCSGTVASEGDNALDITGVCWDAKIMAVKFIGPDGTGNAFDAAEAIYYAVENGADVISNSWGSGFPSTTIEQAVSYAYGQGVVVVAAAGNGNSDWEYYPACYDGVIAVAATDSDDQRASFSSYGDWVDIAAPGVDILSLRAKGTSLGTGYDNFTTIASGTSMACPHVAGACVLLLTIAPGISADELQNALMQTADPIASGICASGRLNVYGSMLRMLGAQGNIWLDSDVYSCCSVIDIKLFDADLSGDLTQQVILSSSEGDFETVLLTETSSALGIFVGSISTVSGVPHVEDGQLQLSHGQIITATYYDANDGTGNAATVTDAAVGDCEGPIIFNVEIDVLGPGPTITFETGEATTARVLYAYSCGDPNYFSAIDAVMTTSHTIKLSNVSPETNYFFVIEANDAVGNQTVDDNNGSCHTFTTDGPGDIWVPIQYHSIQEAIDRSWDGGTVWVADGVYTGDGNHDIDFGGKAVTVRSENGPENCIIDCEGTREYPHRGFYFHSGEDANSVVSGFTITNGYAFGSSYGDKSGGAIRCDDSSPKITHCIITGNRAAWDGGGVHNDHSSPTIVNCSFSANTAVGNDGGAINNDHSSPTITHCRFTGNSAYDWGGAIRNIYSCKPTITNCIISGNSADDGGGMFYWIGCNPTVINCTFVGNSARNGNAVGCDSSGQDSPSNIVLINCILTDGGNEVWNNDDSTITISYSDVCGGYPGIGNVDADPCFVDPKNDDYHLLLDSPCIDAGDNNSVPADTADLDGDWDTTEPIPWDLDGNRRIVDGNSDGNCVVDMGAYEFWPGLCPNPADGATEVRSVASDVILIWCTGARVGSEGQYFVYFGTDCDAVANAPNPDEPSFPTPEYQGFNLATDLEWNVGRLPLWTTYCWRVDEGNQDGTITKGSVWRFTSGCKRMTGDINLDCIVDLKDFARLADDWMKTSFFPDKSEQ